MVEAQLHPEQEARVAIDNALVAAGWLVQDRKDIDLTAGTGVAVREYPTKTGPVDYLLFVEEKAAGTIEAKKVGTPILGVEPQTERYIKGFKALLQERAVPHWGPDSQPLPFHYQSTGAETAFRDLRDPISRPRDVFTFHRPETLARWAKEPKTLLARLQQLPPIDKGHLYPIQGEAIANLEESMANARLRALINMTMGSGKTFVAVSETYRLLRYGKAKRILFLVDRRNLGKQARDAFRAYEPPDHPGKFTELYNVQLLSSNRIDPAANVIITTIQRLYSILRGEAELAEEDEERSVFDLDPAKPLPEVQYRPEVPIELFDVGFIDECHRSIYGRWGAILDYFDMSLVGLTATAEHTARIFFNENVVTEYKHEQAVADGINVPYGVYRIKSEVSEQGGKIPPGSWVGVRTPCSSRPERTQLEDELTYDKAKLDRAVMNPAQIRTRGPRVQGQASDRDLPGPARGAKDRLLLQARTARRGRLEGHS